MPLEGYSVSDVIPIESVSTRTGVGDGVGVGTGVGDGVGMVTGCHIINLEADAVFPKNESVAIH